MKQIILLGSTGSIGKQSLEVIASKPGQCQILGLSSKGNNLELFLEQIEQFKPKYISLADGSKLHNFGKSLKDRRIQTEIVDTFADSELLTQIKTDFVINAIVDSSGLPFSLAVLEAGISLGLANKESLVAGGNLLKQAIQFPNQILPIDSEHSAIFQSLRAGKPSEISKLIVTASGGPFRGFSNAQLEKVTVKDALKHPTWNMGTGITLNSATLVNKGLEIIEAAHLFDVSIENIEVCVHPQSIVHSMVEFIDGSIISQASVPDMRLPISFALEFPYRTSLFVPKIDFSKITQLDFEPLDNEKFPAVELAKSASRAGELYPAVYNAANEILTRAFISEKIGYLDIVKIIEKTLTKFDASPISQNKNVEIFHIFAAEEFARKTAAGLIER